MLSIEMAAASVDGIGAILTFAVYTGMNVFACQSVYSMAVLCMAYAPTGLMPDGSAGYIAVIPCNGMAAAGQDSIGAIVKFTMCSKAPPPRAQYCGTLILWSDLMNV